MSLRGCAASDSAAAGCSPDQESGWQKLWVTMLCACLPSAGRRASARSADPQKRTGGADFGGLAWLGLAWLGLACLAVVGSICDRTLSGVWMAEALGSGVMRLLAACWEESVSAQRRPTKADRRRRRGLWCLALPCIALHCLAVLGSICDRTLLARPIHEYAMMIGERHRIPTGFHD